MSTLRSTMSESVYSEYTDDIKPYRALSKSAVLSLTLAIMSLSAFFAKGLVILPAVGFVFGISSLLQIRRYPNELTGKPAALLGAICCGLLFAGSVSYHVYDYTTEVPPGFERISFSVLQPDAIAKKEGRPIPDRATELHGKKVFVKGYVHPGVAGAGRIKSFILVPDMGTCCFGGQPKLTDMIEVTLTDNAIQYNRRKRKLAGVFKIDYRRKSTGKVQGGFYHLEAEYVK